ncbi:RluA family pseudouridine synthase [Alkaliphilus hydrothermalis]|uniref:Pseudouridine synthase n=1 Tax=Alkaliphilus hydrothermalis TaxID=1482730 RepID=A0ABS2NPQ6_9FIRM|nr:RluA family pseudouridine synthase [Alkaliphilus hydrothermalis]MBM7614884.1 23S rRNA pseudouridine1911/1915/1917 synthase [Alkaliphilus hydrothermalis]
MLISDQQTEQMMVYQVEAEDHFKTIKQVLKTRLDFSSRLLTKLKKDKSVFLNDEYVKYHEEVKEGDYIKILMEEEPNQFTPQDIPFHVIYEDVDVIVINKQPGIVSHPTKSHPIYTIANAASYYLQKKGFEYRIRFVNRLDMDTSGLLVIAKNPYAHHVLSEQMQADLVEKRYITFVEGIVEADAGTIDAPIHRPTEDSIKRVVDEAGQASITRYKVLERYENATMLEVELLTGRTHQIRVHMNHLGHSIIGDTLYGNPDGKLIGRQALHAAYLKFYQPRFKNEIVVKAPLPDDLAELRERLKKEKVEDKR